MNLAPAPFARFERLAGKAALRRLADSQVMIAGLGAVGSFAAEALARSGIGHLRLVDDDRIEWSNVNRQLYALHSTVNRFKVDVATARILDIAPQCHVDGRVARINIENVFSLLEPKPDLVIDAIDSVCDKVSLVWACLSHQIPIVSSMGAARRLEPTQVCTGYLDVVQGCPLAKRVKKGLKALGIDVACDARSMTCVYSREPPAPITATAAEQNVDTRTMGSSICVTGTFGLIAAREAIRILTR